MVLTENQEKERRKVCRLLKQGSDAKLQLGSRNRALERLTKADELAKRTNLSGPIPALVAYRLAHLLLRGNPASRDELEEIDAHLAKASRAKSLGPLPSIYRLSVLHRLKLLDANQYPQSMIETEFSKCVQRVREAVWRSQNPDDSHLRDNPRLQDALVNMLELAGYFMKMPMDSLEGVRDCATEPKRKCYLVGPSPTIALVLLSEELILEELDVRQAETPGALAFCIPGARTPWWRKSISTRPQPLNDQPGRQAAEFLALKLQDPEMDRELLDRKVFGAVGGDNLRQQKLRVRKKLAGLTGFPEADFLSERESVIPANLLIFGAICRV